MQTLECMSKPLDPIFVLRKHEADVQAICFHPRQPLLYSGVISIRSSFFGPDGYQLCRDAEGQLQVWDINSRRSVRQQRLHLPNSGILSLHFLSGDPGRLLSQGRDGLLKLWVLDPSGLPAEKPQHCLDSGSYNLSRCAVLEGCRPDGSAGLLSLADFIKLQQIPAAHPGAHEEPLTGQSGSTQISEAASHEQESSPQQNADTHVNESCVLVAVAGQDASTVDVWHLEAKRVLARLVQPETQMKCGMCMSLAFLGSARRQLLLLVGYEDGTVALWDALSPSAPLTLAKVHTEPVFGLAVNAATAEVFTGSAGDVVIKIGFGNEGSTLEVVRQIQLKKPGIADVAIRQDGLVLATAGWDHNVRIFSCKKLKPLAILKYHRSSIACVSFDPKSNVLASGARDRTIAVWRIY